MADYHKTIGRDFAESHNTTPNSSSSWVQEILLGDFFQGESTWNGTIGNILIGFVPVVGQLADARDTIATYEEFRRDPTFGNFANLGFAGLGWIPGGDLLKVGKKIGFKRIGSSVWGQHKQILENLVKLRAQFRAFKFRKPLDFAAKPSEHMSEEWRFVPMQILKIALEYGKRSPDPRKTKGVFRYTVPMYREKVKAKVIDKNYKGAIYKVYNLVVIIRESDNTILHFHYE